MVLYHKGLQFKDLYPPRAEAIPSNGASHRPTPESPSAPPKDEDGSSATKARVIKTTRYELRNVSGELITIHVRSDLDDGTKSMWYELPDGRKTLDGMPKANLPLYGIHALGDAKMVIVTEGEKAAQALRDIGVPAVGTATGADGCPCDDSLRPLLGLQVVLWPDHDDVGDKHMDAIGTALRRLGQPAHKLFRLTWSDAPPKGDAADFVERGGTKEILNGLLQDKGTTRQWRPQPARPELLPGLAAPSAAITPSAARVGSHHRQPDSCSWREAMAPISSTTWPARSS
jgi:hypothetical protein